MAQRFAPSVVAALVLNVLFGSLTLPAAGDEPKPETIITVAGTGAAGFSGDGGPATQAQLHWPYGLAFDAAGNLYIADLHNQRVRKVSADGAIITVAGTGKPGFSGDGGKATAAQLNFPKAVVVDGVGDLFIAEYYNHRVRKVPPDGIITTVAGTGQPGFSGDNGPATNARLNGPRGLAVDALGNLFIAEWLNNRVRKVTPDGVITTVAGTSTSGFSGDGGPATEVRLSSPMGLAVDALGNLFIADYGNHRVRKVTPDGMLTTVAGTGAPGFSGDDGQATAARLRNPWGVAVDTAGNLFISDWGNRRVRKVSPAGIITTIAGTGQGLYDGDGGQATETGLRGPIGLAIDAEGDLLITDSGYLNGADSPPFNERVLKVFGVAAPGLLAGRAFPGEAGCREPDDEVMR